MTKATQADAYRLLHQGVLAFAHAERQGIRVDTEYCKRTQKKITAKIKRLEEKFYDTKFYRHWVHSRGGKKPNLNSDDHLRHFLYTVKGIDPPKTTPSGKGAADEETLLGLNIPEIDLMLEMRKLKKLRDTYLNGFLKEQVDGFIHPHFHLHLARTYRSSSSAINFQNIPIRDADAQKICRQALYPRRGFQLMEVDYSGIEVCISACYHKDPTMISYIEDPTSDMHGDMAKQIFKIKDFDRSEKGHRVLRNAAKNGFVFPQFYGDYYGNNAYDLAIKWGKLPENEYWDYGDGIEIHHGIHLGGHLSGKGIDHLGAFTDYIQKIEEDFWQRRFPVYNRWKKEWYKEYKKNGYIDMLTGFRCRGPMSPNDATNYPIQGTAFHCLLWSFIQLEKMLREQNFKTRLIGQIHDSIVMDVHPAELDDIITMLEAVMVDALKAHWPWIIVPLDIDIDIGGVDESWYELKPLKETA